MKLFVKYIILLLFLANVKFAQAQQLLVKGYVMSIDSSKVVPLANIFDKTSGLHFISGRNGFFKAKVNLTDSIVITAIGYAGSTLAVKDILPENMEDTIQLFMRPIAYQLNDVTITYFNRTQDSMARIVAEYLKTDPLMNNYDRIINAPQGGLMSPLTAMYMEYSKKGQEMNKFKELLHHAQLLNMVDRRYNKKTIKRATGLDDEYLDEYIKYCKLEPSFILSSSDYDLILAMRKCAERFKQEKGIE